MSVLTFAETFHTIWHRNKKEDGLNNIILPDNIKAMDAFMWCYHNVGKHIQDGVEQWGARIDEDRVTEIIFAKKEDLMRFKLTFLGDK